MKKQRVIITLTDTEPGKVGIEVVFKPSAKNKSSSPAAHLAADILAYAVKRSRGEAE